MLERNTKPARRLRVRRFPLFQKEPVNLLSYQPVRKKGYCPLAVRTLQHLKIYFLPRMESFATLAMRNFTTFLAGILIGSPV